MNAIELIKLTLAQSKAMTMNLVADMRDQPTVMPTPHGGNHPLWVLGHLTYAEAGLLGRFIGGGANPLEKWKPIFGGGSEPVADASKYPSWDELMAEFERVRANTLKTLATYTDADLDRPTNAPENMKTFFGTIGQVFMMIALHGTFHGGQVADARRTAGKKPLRG
jgi:uncharacterized damage-inducible protein DinB